MATPIFLAQSTTEMGITCLRMVMAGYGYSLGTEELRLICGVSRDGADLQSLAQAAGECGFSSRIVSHEDFLTTQTGLEEVKFPAIAKWERGHAVVVLGRKGDTWEFIDPISGRRFLKDDEFNAAVTGGFLVLEPGPEFVPNKELPGMLTTLIKQFHGSASGVAFVVITGLALIVPGIITPGLIRLFVDEYLIAGDRDQAGVILVGLALSLALLIIFMTMQLRALRRLTTITVTRATARFVWHTLRMPAWFFSQRDSTTLAYRVGLTEKLAELMSGPFASAILAQLTSLFFLIVMFVLSPILGLVSLVGYFLLVALIWRVAALRLEVRQKQAREVGVTATQIGISIRVLETLKATGSESVAFDRIFSSMSRNLSLGVTHLWAWFGMLPVLMTALISTLVLSAGAILVIEDVITQGTLAAFTILLGGFIAPISVLVPSIDGFLNVRGALEQTGDVLEQPVDVLLRDNYADGAFDVDGGKSEDTTDKSGESAAVPHAPEPRNADDSGSRAAESDGELDDLTLLAFQGRKRRTRMAIDPWAASLEIHGVSFGYTLDAPPLLSAIDITVEPGRVVAIVGHSGSGKSTIGRLVAGLYQPWSGYLSIDGRRLNDYPRAARAQELGFVDQDTVIYRASVRDNLSMFDRDVSDRDMITAAKAACIHDDIIARPGGYEAMLAEDGLDLSGGQRQRLGIARALVRQPRLLVLDEATSALDARTEAVIVQNLRSLGCTSLVIAHRLSTVRDADEIIVVDKGGISERGTHLQLSDGNGLYRTLMDA